MSDFVIKGNRALSGKVIISGSKNAALPLIFSTLITEGVSVLRGVPDISDVTVALEIISSLGAEVTRDGDLLRIDTTNLKYKKPSDELVSKIRASSYLLGANLSRFKIAHIQSFGGCNFDSRPIDMHIHAMTLLGGTVNRDVVAARELVGNDIYFSKISVGATVNAILLAATAKGKSRIFGYAREPHIISLIEFLKKCGADIELFCDRIEIVGARLSGAEATVIPDMIEVGTYTALSLMTDSKIAVSAAYPEHLSSFLDALCSAGASVTYEDGFLRVSGGLDSFLHITAEPYPGFPTDLQPQMAPLLAAFSGGRITDRVWNGRFGYLSELEKFGIRYALCSNGALVFPSRIRSSKASVPDLRGGAALMMCALYSDGESVIKNAEIIKRGYSDIVNKLRKVGADIEEVK